jgi:hypothetical protein
MHSEVWRIPGAPHLLLHCAIMTLPKSLHRFAEKIEDFENQRAIQNGYWVHLRTGFINPTSETHIIHETTLAECIVQLREVEPCSCADCQQELSREQALQHPRV